MAVTDEPTEHACVACNRRQYERAQVCEPCRNGVPKTLEEVVKLCLQLDAAAVTPKTDGERVAGGGYVAPVPVNLDAIDLAGPARPQSRALAARGQLGLDDCQTGHLSVATMLDTWVHDWANLRGQDEHPPVPTVAALAWWLAGRWEWACDHHPRIGDYTADLHEYERTLRAVTGVDKDDRITIGRCPGQRGHTCGAVLKATPWQTSAECPRCFTRWPRVSWLNLRQAA
jgi:hypothetical protein